MEKDQSGNKARDSMDDVEASLNALLADLQTNLNKAPHPASQLHPVPQQTPPPNFQDQNTQHVYRYEATSPSYKSDYDPRNSQSPMTPTNGYHTQYNRDISATPSPLSSVSIHPTYQNVSPAKETPPPMYRHEMREEVRTESRSSGPTVGGTQPTTDPNTPRSAIANNLSELDTLLHDLNTTKQNSYVKETKVVNGGSRPSDQLNNSGVRNESFERHTSSHTDASRPLPPRPTPPATHTHTASNATRELDDLMDSLSDFKINTNVQSQPDPSTYAKPIPKRRSTTPPPPPPEPQKVPQPEPPVQRNQLDSMLGSLTTHMTEQGINTSQKGCCCACDKPIVGQVITALGKPWHPEHFTCTHCKEELGTRNFFERDGKPYCEPDYHNLFSPKCAYCSGPILDKCVTAMNETWHPEHFFCAMCGKTFGDDGFHEKNGKAYCKHDYFNMFAPKCGGCNNPITENYISALNSQWHPECFVCRDCNQPFNGGSFFDHEGLPYCETHFHAKRGSLCAACNKPITGRCITAMFRKYHPEHFLCAFCLQQLNKGTFKEQNNKPYCHTCFDKLYG